MKKLGILISGSGSNMKAIVNACETGKVDADIAFVGSDNPEAAGLAWAKEKGIPTFVVDYRDFSKKPGSTLYNRISEMMPWDRFDEIVEKGSGIIPRSKETYDDKALWMAKRINAEHSIVDEMLKLGFDYLILAGFMKNLSPYFIDRINADMEEPKILNIHPALLPAFPGTDGYGDTYRYGCKVGGCTVHFVDYGEDTGPIIGQGVVDIEPGDSLDDFKKKGLEKEWEVYPRCIQLVVSGKTKLVTNEHKGKTRKVVQ